jgi:hypothetical protein
MKKYIVCIVFILIGFRSQGQISRQDVLPLFSHLGKEEFKQSYQLADKLLRKFDADTTHLMGIVRYALLYSGASLIAKDELTYKALRQDVKRVKGRFILMTGHPTTTDSTQKAYNTNTLRYENGKVKGATITTSKGNTAIYFFEYFDFKDVFDIASVAQSNTRCGGILNEIEFNPNQSNIWIMRLHIREAVLTRL